MRNTAATSKALYPQLCEELAMDIAVRYGTGNTTTRNTTAKATMKAASRDPVPSRRFEGRIVLDA
jgi:hypothetical protein